MVTTLLPECQEVSYDTHNKKEDGERDWNDYRVHPHFTSRRTPAENRTVTPPIVRSRKRPVKAFS